MSNNANKQAFPVAASYTDDYPQVLVRQGGLTKREYFAAMAMQGLAASNYWAENFTEKEEHLSKAILISVKAADELLKQLEQTKTP